jgi:hypothetical protein
LGVEEGLRLVDERSSRGTEAGQFEKLLRFVTKVEKEKTTNRIVAG